MKLPWGVGGEACLETHLVKCKFLQQLPRASRILAGGVQLPEKMRMGAILGRRCPRPIKRLLRAALTSAFLAG